MHVGRNLVTCIPVGNGDGGAIFAKLKISGNFPCSFFANGLRFPQDMTGTNLKEPRLNPSPVTRRLGYACVSTHVEDPSGSLINWLLIRFD
jgi:hypothetical protein